MLTDSHYGNLQVKSYHLFVEMKQNESTFKFNSVTDDLTRFLMFYYRPVVENLPITGTQDARTLLNVTILT